MKVLTCAGTGEIVVHKKLEAGKFGRYGAMLLPSDWTKDASLRALIVRKLGR